MPTEFEFLTLIGLEVIYITLAVISVITVLIYVATALIHIIRSTYKKG